MTASDSREQRGAPRSALWAVAASAAVLSVLAFFLFGAKGLIAAAAGGAIAVANLWAVSRVVRGLVAESRLRSRYSLLAVVKMAALFGAVFLLVESGLPILAIAVGYASLPIGIVIGQLWAPAPADDETVTNKG